MSIKEKLKRDFIKDYMDLLSIYNPKKAFIFASSNKSGALLSSLEIKQIKKELGV
jgi:hypothetical protein